MPQPANRRLVTEQTLDTLVDAAYATAVPANLPARLREGGGSVTNWNNALSNGWYSAFNASNAPSGVLNGWVIVRVEQLLDNPLYVTQHAHESAIGASNIPKSWIRVSDNGVWSAWERVYDTATEVAAVVRDSGQVARGNAQQITNITSDGTVQITSGTSISGVFKLYFGANDRVQRATLLVDTQQFGIATVKVLDNYIFNGQTVLSNFRVTGNAAGSMRYLLADVANRNGGTVLYGEGHLGGLVSLSTTGFEATAITNVYQEPFGDTGWRRIVSTGQIGNLPNLAAAIRRIGNEVTVITTESVAASFSGYSTLLTPPAGFGALNASGGLGTPVYSGTVVDQTAAAVPGAAIYVEMGTPAVALKSVSGNRHISHLKYTTADAWPTTLPGVSA